MVLIFLYSECMKRNQKGSSHTLIVLVVVLLCAVGFAMWNVKSKDKKQIDAATTDTPVKASTRENTFVVQAQKTFSFQGGEIKFADNGEWKLATGGYWNNELRRCGRSTEYDTDCLDTQMRLNYDLR